MVVLDVLVGNKGCGESVLLLHVLLGLVPLSGHLVELVGLGGSVGGVQHSAVYINLLSFVPCM